MIPSLFLSMIIYLTVNMMNSQDIIEPGDPCSACEKQYTFRGSKKGIFTSPDFPNEYSDRTTCCYFFHAADDGRVKIEFDYFDLEEPSDNGCNFDYIAISSINNQGYKEPKFIYCGSATPPMYISTYSKLEIIFHSDFTKTAKGFIGHYEFLGKTYKSLKSRRRITWLQNNNNGGYHWKNSIDSDWHPFSPSTVGCGPGYLTGVGGTIESPYHPSPYPAEAGCTWIIKVAENERILLTFITMEISNNAICQDSNVLMIFDGYITPEKLPLRYCSQLKHEATSRRQFLSKTDRLVIRFQSGVVNPDNKIGIKAAWTAVTLTNQGDCAGFQCLHNIQDDTCESSREQLCNNKHLCIHTSLQCNELPNCGYSDMSDENKCLKQVLTLAAYIGGPIVLVIIIIITVICCYRKYCRPTLRYAVPKEQSLTMTQSLTSTQSSNVHVRSLERSPRTSSIMYTTSFTDCSVPPTPDTEENKIDKYNNVSNCNSLSLPHTAVPQTTFGPINTHAPDTTSGHSDTLDEGQVNYKGHQKRPSYQLMRELCYEDGNVIIADI